MRTLDSTRASFVRKPPRMKRWAGLASTSPRPMVVYACVAELFFFPRSPRLAPTKTF